MVDIQAFRSAMAKLAAAVNVITTDGEHGRAGFTATAVCSVTDQPPMLLVCMNRSSWAHKVFAGNAVLGVNVLAADGHKASRIFSDRDIPMGERFDQVPWSRSETGSPLLDDALVNFDCRVSQTHDFGTHSVFFCDVVAVRSSSHEVGLVYFNRAFHGVGSLSDARI